MAAYAKADHERVCAGARKLRLDLDRSLPPAGSGTVDAVLVKLDGVHGATVSRLGRVGGQLVKFADEAPTHRSTHEGNRASGSRRA